jgi:hypothetical protein
LAGSIRARERKAEQSPVKITAAFAPDLRLLTAATDEPGADIAASVHHLAADTAVGEAEWAWE